MILKITVKKDNKIIGSFSQESLEKMIESDYLTKDDFYSFDNGITWDKIKNFNNQPSNHKIKFYSLILLILFIPYYYLYNKPNNKINPQINNFINSSKNYFNKKLTFSKNNELKNNESETHNITSSNELSNTTIPKGKRLYNEDLMNEVSKPANLEEDN